MASVSDSVSLAADFPSASRDDWRALVSGVLTRSGATQSDPSQSDPSQSDPSHADPERALSSITYDGIEIRPLYTAEDLVGDFADWRPGRPPFVRGTDVEVSTGWDVRQHHADPDPVRLNQAIRTDLENGVTSAWLTIGDGSLSVADLPRALDGVYLDLAPIALDAGRDSRAAALAFLELARHRSIADTDLAGTLGLDPIAVHARTGVATDFGAVVDLADAARQYPKLNPITVDGTTYHDAGGSDASELAIAAAVAVAYLRALTDAGWDIDSAFGQLEFRYAISADQFLSIAKLRAARRLWNRVGELCGVAPGRRGQRQHAVTSRAMISKRDPLVNMLRTTLACFAAATAGAQMITVLPFDSAIGYPDDFARRIARNTHSILHDEASLAWVTDPAGGSWYVESITSELASVAWSEFTAIERAGGALAALDSGHIPQLLAATAARRAEAIARRKDPLTGVSEFAFINEAPLRRTPWPAGAFAGARSAGALLPVMRYGQDFEALRDRADAATVTGDCRPTVFLAGLGPLSVNSGRVGFAANLYQTGGIEVVNGSVATDGSDLDAMIAVFTASGCRVACLCSSDKVYAELAAPVAAALKQAGATQVWLAGRPGERAESDAQAGIDGHLYVGCDAIDVLDLTLRALGVH